MKKLVRTFGVIIVLAGIALILTKCKKDESSYGTLSGIVSLEGTAADGAIVTLSAQANAADIIARVVADA